VGGAGVRAAGPQPIRIRAEEFVDCRRERSAVTDLLLDVAHNRTLRERAQRKHVADVKHGLLTAVHKLTRVQTFGSDKRLSDLLVVVRVTECDTSKRSTTVE